MTSTEGGIISHALQHFINEDKYRVWTKKTGGDIKKLSKGRERADEKGGVFSRAGRAWREAAGCLVFLHWDTQCGLRRLVRRGAARRQVVVLGKHCAPLCREGLWVRNSHMHS